jgi:uncharacterized protein (TIGR02588 family)
LEVQPVGNSGEKTQGDNEGGKEQKGRTTAEWVTLGISTLIVLALAGLVVFQAITQGTRPPQIEIEPLTEEVKQVGESYYLPISVTNSGDKAVEAVEVEVELRVEGDEPETIGFTVQFLAGLETDTHTVILSGDPRSGELTFTTSFHEP